MILLKKFKSFHDEFDKSLIGKMIDFLVIYFALASGCMILIDAISSPPSLEPKVLEFVGPTRNNKDDLLIMECDSNEEKNWCYFKQNDTWSQSKNLTQGYANLKINTPSIHPKLYDLLQLPIEIQSQVMNTDACFQIKMKAIGSSSNDAPTFLLRLDKSQSDHFKHEVKMETEEQNVRCYGFPGAPGETITRLLEFPLDQAIVEEYEANEKGDKEARFIPDILSFNHSLREISVFVTGREFPPFTISRGTLIKKASNPSRMGLIVAVISMIGTFALFWVIRRQSESQFGSGDNYD